MTMDDILSVSLHMPLNGSSHFILELQILLCVLQWHVFWLGFFFSIETGLEDGQGA